MARLEMRFHLSGKTCLLLPSCCFESHKNHVKIPENEKTQESLHATAREDTPRPKCPAYTYGGRCFLLLVFMR
jgi:hypothetical protein